MYECMHVCMYYVCMRLCTPIGAPLGAPIANRRADRRPVCCRCVPVKYAHIENVCIYRRADYTGSAIYVCMHAYTYVLCIYVCLYSNRRAIRLADR